MDYHSYLQNQNETQLNDECLLNGTCSPSPVVAFSHELIISYLQELSFYLLKLKEIGITNEQIKKDVLNVISGIIMNMEYEQAQFFETINKIYADLQEAKELYISVCKRNDLKTFIMKSKLKNPKSLVFSEAIAAGQKIFIKKYEKLTPERLNILDLIMNISKNLAMHLIELRSLDSDDDDTYDAILNLLNFRRFHEDFEVRAMKVLTKFAQFDHDISMKLYEIKKKRYGNLTSVNISLSTRPNKAILVSGTDLRELEMILEATKDKNIDVYTQGKMLYAHGYSAFRKYPHLVGHFGKEMDSCLVDFAEFPGVIFVTQNSFKNLKNLFRSNIFTTNVISPKGVIRIKDNNFEPLIQAALNAKGFRKGRKEHSIKININEAEIINKINDAMAKIQANQLKNIFVIGISDHTKEKKEYFNDFLNLLDKDSFVISFSYSNKKPNVLLVESELGLPILFETLKKLSETIDLSKLNIVVMLSRFEVYTISTIIYMKNAGIKTIYMSTPATNQINPAIIETFRKLFDIKKYTEPANDLINIMKFPNET